jgi:hypothetical protein
VPDSLANREAASFRSSSYSWRSNSSLVGASLPAISFYVFKAALIRSTTSRRILSRPSKRVGKSRGFRWTIYDCILCGLKASIALGTFAYPKP